MDQSVYVRQSIESLVEEGILGAVLCSLVILLFLGEWRMTAIAVLTIPVAVLAAVVGLLATGQTINVMTLGGLALAIGPMVDSAIICLENTHRHLGLGASPEEAAYLGASEVALPELVSTLCTFLVLAPLALMPGLGAFLFRPMAMAVAFAMIAAYLLSRTFVPSRSARWLRPHQAHGEPDPGAVARGVRPLGGPDRPRDRRVRPRARRDPGAALVDGRRSPSPPGGGPGRLGPSLRREFFPEVDAGAFEMAVRAAERHPDRGDRAAGRGGRGVRPAKRSASRPPADHLRDRRGRRPVGRLHAQRRADGRGRQGPARTRAEASAQEYVRALRDGLARDPRFADLEFAFDAGGMIRAAMNEGKSTPINVRVTGKDLTKARAVADAIRAGSRGSTASSTPGSSSGSTTPSTSSTSTGPRPPTSG